MDVIGAGFGRTGTLSLKAALEDLGFGPCMHMIPVLEDVDRARLFHKAAMGDRDSLDAAMDGFRSTVDWHATVWDGTFDGRFADRAFAVKVFEEHNAAVRREVPAGRLLEFEVADGWEPLCEFLDRPVPDHDFPRLNDTAQFQRMVAGRHGLSGS
jgi:hypothetical protein